MLRLFSLLSFLFLHISAVFFIPEYKSVECGDVISEQKGVILPKGAACEVKVTVPEGSQVTMMLLQEGGGQLACKKITVVDESNGEKYHLCRNLEFIGSSSVYSLKLKNLPQNVRMQIFYDKQHYRCGEQVTHDRLMTPVTFVNDGSSGAGPCFLVVPTSDVLRVQSEYSHDDECAVKVQISQGKHIRRMMKSTQNYCIGQEGVETEIPCGLAIVFLEGPVGTEVSVSTVDPPRKDPLNSLFRYYIDCDEFQPASKF